MSLKSKWKKLWQKIKDWLNPPPEPEPDPPPPEPTPPDPEPPTPPAPGEFTVNPAWTGFLWKPVGENSKKLRVLLPPEWKRERFDRNRVEIWSGGKKLETIDSIGPGNPLPGRGDREHFAGNRQGKDYPAGCTVRAKTIAGEEWEWPIAKPADRNGDVKARKVTDAAPVEPTPEPTPSDEDFTPPARTGHELFVGDGKWNSFREVGHVNNPKKLVRLSCWALIHDWPRPAEGCFLVNKGLVGTSWAFALVVGPGWVKYQATKGPVQVYPQFRADEWHHYQVEAVNSYAKFWIDGKFIGSAKADGFGLLGVSDQPLRVGGYFCPYEAASWYNASLNGEMSDFKVEIE